MVPASRVPAVLAATAHRNSASREAGAASGQGAQPRPLTTSSAHQMVRQTQSGHSIQSPCWVLESSTSISWVPQGRGHLRQSTWPAVTPHSWNQAMGSRRLLTG
jgi:hypothetical protein